MSDRRLKSRPPAPAHTESRQRDAEARTREQQARMRDEQARVRDHFADLCRLSLNIRLSSYHAQAVYWGIINRTWWRNYEHAHSFFEVCYCYSGGGTFTLEGVEHAISAGDVFIARPGEVHQIVSAVKKPMFIHFWAFTLVRETATLQAADARVDALLGEFIESRRRILPAGPNLDPLVLSLCTEVSERQPGYQTVIRGLAERLILDVARRVSETRYDAEELPLLSATTGDPVVNDTIRYIRFHLASKLEIADIAAQVNLSERHLTRLFRSQTGKSLLEFITNERIALACQLLVERKLSIKQVARAVGYPDAHYFTTLFGRKTGKTPSAFRESGGTRFLGERSRE